MSENKSNTRLRQKTTTLYDGGSGIVTLVFGFPFGVILDWIWNWLVLYYTLHFYGKISTTQILGRFLTPSLRIYAFLITVLGFLIDWLYFKMIWIIEYHPHIYWIPRLSLPLQLILILLPVILLFGANMGLSFIFLRTRRDGVSRPIERHKKVSLIVSISMAVLTAPWILPVLPYIAGWTK
jgi:hypothetical protein